jgi:hypothetical protein
MIDPFVIARTADAHDVEFVPGMGNRHGLITGATGTGKTVSLQLLADHFSKIGVPVFLADVKGDLSGVGAAGTLSAKLKERLAATGHRSRRSARTPRRSGTSAAAVDFRCARRSPTSDRCSSVVCST